MGSAAYVFIVREQTAVQYVSLKLRLLLLLRNVPSSFICLNYKSPKHEVNLQFFELMFV